MIKKLFFITLMPLALSPLTIISCSKAITSPEANSQNTHHQWLSHNPEYFANEISASGQSNYILSTAFYNQLYSDPSFDHDTEITIVIIAEQNIYSEIVAVSAQTVLSDALNQLYYMQVQMLDIPFIGLWLATFKIRQEDNNFSDWKHGLNENQNYNNYYPLYWVNHHKAQNGVLSWKIKPGDIYEISYDVEL